MVVSRKNPAPPAPVASRTTSSQSIPRKHKLQEQLAESTPQPPPPSPQKPQKTKQTAKRKRPTQEQPPTSFWDKIFFLSLFSFTVYAAVVCPPYFQQPQTLQDPSAPATCRTLLLYRTHVLEPYVLPPIKSAYTYTAAASAPLIHSAQPYTQPIVDTTLNIHHIATPKLVGAYEKTKSIVVPWYHRAFLPRWRQHVAPRLEAGWKQGVEDPLRPYFHRIHIESVKVQKQLHHFLHTVVLPYYDASRPYINFAVTKSTEWSNVAYRIGSKWSVVAFQYTKEWSCQAWKVAKPFVLSSSEKARVLAKKSALEALEARRRYVDPHVIKILEKVDGNQSTVETKDEPVTVPPPKDEPATQPSEVIPPTPEPTEFAEEESSSTVVLESIPATESPVPVEVKVQPEEPVITPVDVEAGHVNMEPPEATPEEAVEEETTAVPEAASTPTPSPSSSSGSAVIGGAEAKSTSEGEVELDDFLSELGVDFGDEEAEPSAGKPAEPVPTQEVVEEDPQAKAEAEAKAKAALAARRAAIVARHVDWQAQLDELAAEQAKRVFVDIEAIREFAVAELGWEFAPKEPLREPLSKLPGLPQSRYRIGELDKQRSKGFGLGSRALEGLNKQGERFLRGLDTYLGSLEERRAGKNGWVKPDREETEAEKTKRKQNRETEKTRWGEVVAKVEGKFEKLTKDVQDEVHRWYLGIRGREVEAVTEAAASIKTLADRAQGDLAMDYAWLDDVTTDDWAKYHLLMTTFDDFQVTGTKIQNGTYVPAGIYTDAPSAQTIDSENEFDEILYGALAPEYDPLVTALDNLEQEYDDLIAGFKQAVSVVKSRAGKVLSEFRDISDDADDEEGFFAVKHEKGERVDDMRAYLAAKEKKIKTIPEPEPEVSILPISGPAGGAAEGAAQIFIGKDPVQVEQAVKQAEAAKRDEL